MTFKTKTFSFFDETIRKHSKSFLQQIKKNRASEVSLFKSQNNFDAMACSKQINYLEKDAGKVPDVWVSAWEKTIAKANKNLLFFVTMEEASKKPQPNAGASAE